MAPRKPNRNRGTVDKETAGLLRQSSAKAKALANNNKKFWVSWRKAYAQRTNADTHDDKGVMGVNRGENWTSESLPNPGGGDK
ncbi:MAG: hypothetical protein IIA89_02035 [Chloroflexi bacterium]|nr:hypothetical protein [Chloroflexota bacterium]